MFAGNFAPAGWMFCDGQILPISEYETLFNLIGTTYGGDGQSTFNLPDLRGRLPNHQGSGYVLAESGGVEQVTLTASQIPAHSHPFLGSTDPGSQATPVGFVPAASNIISRFKAVTSTQPASALAPQGLSSDGGSQPHSNFQPYLGINFIISLFGIYPSPT